MRRLIIAASFAIAGSLAGASAQAMPLSGLSGQAATSVVPVYTKCRWVSDGYGGRVQQCWEVQDYVPPVYVPRRYYGDGYYGGYRGGY